MSNGPNREPQGKNNRSELELHTYSDYAKNGDDANVKRSEHSQDRPEQVGPSAGGFASFDMLVPVEL